MNKNLRLAFLFLFLILSISSIAQSPLVKKWDHRYGGTDNDFLTWFQQTADGGYALIGYTISGIGGDKSQGVLGGWDYWVVKVDSVGILQWEKNFGGTNGDQPYSLHQTTDGGFIIGGLSYSGTGGDKSQASRGGTDYWVLKLDALGNKQWDKRFGGTGDDGLCTVQQTKDGGYILGGYSNSGAGGDKSQASRGGEDYWIVKTDALGVKQWDMRYGSSGFDSFKALQQTKDGGYILVGNSASNAGGDKSQNTFGTADFWIIKTDSLGAKQWDKDYGGVNSDVPDAVRQTKDGGYIIGGFSNSPAGNSKTQPVVGAYDFWMMKTDSLGNKQWDKDFGGTGDEDDVSNISQTMDGGYLMGGTSYSPLSGDKTEANLGTEQTWIVKTDANGIKQWDKTLHTNSVAYHDEAGVAWQTADGCYAFANHTSGGIGGDKTETNRDATENSVDFWLIKFCDTTQAQCPVKADFISLDTTAFCEESGRCISFTDQSTCNPTSWKWTFPGALPDTSTQQNPTNICYYVPGTYSVTLIAADSVSSDTLKIPSFVIFASGADAPIVTQVGDTLFCSHASTYQWYFNGSPIPGATDSFYVATLCGVYGIYITDSYGCARLSTFFGAPCGVNDLSAQGIQIFPNPARDQFTVYSLQFTAHTTLQVYDMLGKKVYDGFLNSKQETINCKLFSPGIYLVEVNAGDKVYRTKFVKQ